MSSLDLAQIQELKEIMEDAFDDLISTYLKDSEEKLIKLNQAISSQDSAEIAELAHSIKGASANIFAEELSELCRIVEDAGRANQVDNLSADLDAINTEFAKVKSELKALS